MEQQNPFQQIGLPATFAPTPLGWQFAKVDANTPTGPVALHLVLIDTVLGRLGFAFSSDDLTRFANQILEQTSGLTIATGIPENGTRKFKGFSGR